MIRPIRVMGAGWFPSVHAASKILDISPKAVRFRVESAAHSGWCWDFAVPVEWSPPTTPAGGWRKALGIRGSERSGAVPCKVDGVEYPSYREAGLALGMSGPAVRQRCHSTTERFKSWRFWDTKDQALGVGQTCYTGGGGAHGRRLGER